MEGGLCFADYAVIGVFFATMIGIGLWSRRRAKDANAYFGKDKSASWWLSGISFYMNSFSALAFVMYSALAYKYGFLPVTVSWLLVPSILIASRWLAVRWRRAAQDSPIDFIAHRYTPKMCSFVAWCGMPMQALDNAIKLFAISTVVGVGMGFPLFWSICMSGLIIIVYTFLGGLKAALACDFIQFFVILAVVFALPPLCLDKLAALDPAGGAGWAHGWQVFVDRAPGGFFSLTAPEAGYNWFYLISVPFFLNFLTLSTNWPLIQRYAATKSDRDAKKMTYLVAALLVIGPPLMFFPAMAARVFMSTPIADADMNGVYAILCREVLPGGMMGLVIAAMFSATMSSLAGNFNAVASVVTNELYAKIDRHATPRRLMLAGKIATVAVGVIVIGLTFVMQYAQGAKDLFSLSNQVFSVFLAPITLPMIAGVLIRPISKRAGLTALVGGIALGLALFFLAPWLSAHFNGIPDMRGEVPMTWFTSIVTVVLLLVGTKLFPDRAEEKPALDKFFAEIECKSID